MLEKSINGFFVSSVFSLFTATGGNKRIVPGSFTIIQASVDLVRGFGNFF